MFWDPDRLPIAVPPIAGEALDSWIEAYARRLRTTSRDFLNFMGLHLVPLDAMVASLEDHEVHALQRSTGIGGESPAPMALPPFGQHTLNPKPAAPGLAHSPPGRIKACSHRGPASLAPTP